jgi:long-subunit fatty acid transport protein
MTDYFHADAGTSIAQYDPAKMDASTPDKMYSDYELRTPDKWIFSAAAVIEQYGLISVDYEIANYKGMRLYDYNGDASPDNEYIKQDFGTGNMLKIGAEFKVTPQFAVRAGGAWQSSPVNTGLKNGDVEVLTAGTLPHYTVDKGANYFTVGLGYRFTPNFYSDIACLFKTHKQDVYMFSRTFLDNGDLKVDSTPASLKTNTTRVALTLGYKF